MELTQSKIKPKQPHPDEPQIVLTHADVEQIGKDLQKYILDKQGLLDAIKSVTSINVQGIGVLLEPRLLERLKTRCHDKANWPKWLADTVVRQLHDYAGW